MQKRIEPISLRIRIVETSHARITEGVRAEGNEAPRFRAGANVSYYSGTYKSWIPAVVQKYDAATNTYQLDCKASRDARTGRTCPLKCTSEDMLSSFEPSQLCWQ